ncbi:MAG: response regulator [bacterium]|nr:response regulator [bacterium]
MSEKDLIFFVEDKDEFRNYIEGELKSWGYQVETASVAREASEKFKELKGVKLAILDLGLPEETAVPPRADIGFNLLAEIRKLNRRIPVIILTGTLAEIKYAVRAIKEGACNYILKSEVDERLEDAIASAISQPPVDPEGDFKWLLKNMPELQEKFAGNWIAVVNEKVVASGKMASMVYEKLQDKYPQVEPFIYAVPEKEEIPWI